ncbi:MAG: 2-oxoacid:acceptor oxidoreductase family protein [Candidatus Bathyarchaeia archaeon]
MIEIRIHGRGGQGAVTSSKIAGIAASLEGKFAQGLPFYGFERRGAPLTVFLRIDDRPITVASRIYEPDGIIVLDSALAELSGVVGVGLKEGGFAVLNTLKKPDEVDLGVRLSKIATLDATGVALKTLGLPITNTAILGALCKTTGVVKLESLEEGVKAVLPPRIHGRNVKALRTAYDEVVVREW